MGALAPLTDAAAAVGRHWQRLPPLVRWGLLAAGAYGGLRLMGCIGPPRLDEDAIARLPRIAGDQTKLAVARWLVDELYRDGTLTLDEIAVILTLGYWETGLQPHAVSAEGMPDDAVGRSWGVVQLAGTTIQWLGLTLRDVVALNRTPSELERATRGSARAAVQALVRPRPGWADGRTYLEAVRTLYREDLVAQAREIAVRWQAGQGRRWTDVLRHRPTNEIGKLGWMHFTIPHRLTRLPAFRVYLGLEPLWPEVDAWIDSTHYPERERWNVRLRE